MKVINFYVTGGHLAVPLMSDRGWEGCLGKTVHYHSHDDDVVSSPMGMVWRDYRRKSGRNATRCWWQSIPFCSPFPCLSVDFRRLNFRRFFGASDDEEHYDRLASDYGTVAS
ncbi:MATE efflux family protein [Anopheles sinensis]|uniref:MATE efflux family protein n=1 Tax=Anopheles sinensis TaxID=74873 RepID=A0A084W5T8_ANOSI|nr:MATE efflux family protein [Anopheles sinensis]